MPSFSVLLHIWCCYKTYTIKGLLLCPWCVVTTAANLHPYQTVATYHRLPCKIQWVHLYLWLSKVKAQSSVQSCLRSNFKILIQRYKIKIYEPANRKIYLAITLPAQKQYRSRCLIARYILEEQVEQTMGLSKDFWNNLFMFNAMLWWSLIKEL